MPGINVLWAGAIASVFALPLSAAPEIDAEAEVPPPTTIKLAENVDTRTAHQIMHSSVTCRKRKPTGSHMVKWRCRPRGNDSFVPGDLTEEERRRIISHRNIQSNRGN